MPTFSGVLVRKLGDHCLSQPPEGCIILPVSILHSGLPVPFPQVLCKLLYDLNIAPRQLHSNVLCILISTLVLLIL